MLTCLCLLLWLPGFFTLPPSDRDESRFAQATKQMNESGDYVRILNGTVPRNRKPIGIHWLQAPAAALAGQGLANPIWPYRIPSLLGALAAVLATYRAGRRLTQSDWQAFLAAAMLAGCVILTTEVHIAKTDAALLGATTIAMAILSRAWLSLPIPRWLAAIFWLAIGAGILIKGPITPMVAGLTAGALCLQARRASWLRPLRAKWGLPLMLAVVAPWFIAIFIATHGAFFAQAVGKDLVGKLAGGSESHGGFPGLHLVMLLVLAFPATPLVLQGLAAAWGDRRHQATQFLIAWALPSWLVFEAVPTKLPHYTLPLYPAIFLLAARGLSSPTPKWLRRLGISLLAAITILLAAALLGLPYLLGQNLWMGVPAALCLLGVAALAWKRPIQWAVFACVPLYAAILQFELPGLTPLWIAPRVAQSLRQHWPAYTPTGAGLAVAGYAEPSLVFLAGTQTQLLPNGAAAAAALKQGTAGLVLVTDQELGAFMASMAPLSAKQLDQISGFNYSRGRWVTLTEFTR